MRETSCFWCDKVIVVEDYDSATLYACSPKCYDAIQGVVKKMEKPAS